MFDRIAVEQSRERFVPLFPWFVPMALIDISRNSRHKWKNLKLKTASLILRGFGLEVTRGTLMLL